MTAIINIDALPNALINLRRAQGMTQAEVSEAIGFCVTSICMWEKGHRSPSFFALKQLADCYRCAIGFAITEGDER